MTAFLNIRNWLWRGSFEVEGSRLAVWEGLSEESRGQDLLGRTAQYLAELGRLNELAREIENRQQTGAEAELRNSAKAMLPALDGFERVLEFYRGVKDPSEEFANCMKAVEGAFTRLERTLEKVGLRRMSAIGMEVDLSVHDVVETRVTGDYPENTVIEERQAGYYFRGRLLRDAKVVVALPS